jgi:uncharacterized protein YndB with AHSA1/START domain
MSEGAAVRGPHVPAIELAIETAAPPALAWATLTEPARVALWLTEASPVGPVGSPYQLDFGDRSIVTGEVLELEPGRRFAHSWAWDDGEPGETTVVAWTVEPLDGGGSRVRLVHGGWDTAGANATARDDHAGYWAGYLHDLRDVLGEG